MAELALAIFPLGITVTSGLVKYLKAFNDHDDDRARLLRQAQRFSGTFQSLEVAFKRSQLIPEISTSAAEASVCLKDCQESLEELDTLQQEIFANTALTNHNAHTKEKIKDGFKKLIYPLRKSDIETLEGALNKLSTTLTLALGILHLDGEFLMKNKLNEQMAEIQKNTIVNSNTSTVLKELRQPISRIDLAVPTLQTSVDSILPHVDRKFDQISYQYTQMQAQVTSLLDMAQTLETYRQFSCNQSGELNYHTIRETEQERPTLAKRVDLEPMCSCPSRRMRQRKGFALGPVHFVEEILSNHCHEKGCVFFIPSPGYEKTRAIRFTGLASLLKRSIEVSLSTRAWSGVFSISPSFTYLPVVDWKKAPAFLVMILLRDASKLKKLDEARSKAILSAAQQKLRELFCSGRASPNDVSPGNHTLLHALAGSVYRWSNTLQRANSPFMRLTCQGLVNLLVAAGTSVAVRDVDGSFAWHMMIDGTFVPASIYDQLIPGNDVEDRSSQYVPSWPDRLERLNYNNHNPKVARIQYGPLSLAIIRNNLLEVERLISLHPHMLEEASFYGETPLHIAIYRLDILRVLAKKVSPILWSKLDHSFSTVLGLALQVSHEICNTEKNSDESCCPCTLPLKIILAAGCPIMPYRDFRCGSRRDILDGSFFDGSPHCKSFLVKELQSRRQQLRDLAQQRLSITELSNFIPLEEVPDVDAIAIDRLLRQKGILGLGPLSTFVDGDLPQQPVCDVGYYSRSIYFDLTAPEDADLFFDSDFKMICSDDDHESSLDRALFGTQVPWIRYISLSYAQWLFDHQAPLWKWSYRFTSPMPSIFVLADIFGMQDDKRPGRDEAGAVVERYLSESGLVDNCSCLCSPDGCTPFASRMKWLAHHPYKGSEDLAPQDYATAFGSHVEMHGRSISLSQHVIMVRQATFAALDLKHTCLDRPGYSCRPSDDYPMYWLNPVTELELDEKEFEIANVDAEAMNQLEKMVLMFHDFVLTGNQTTISSERDSLDIDDSVFNPLSALGIDDLYYERILAFWQHIWAKRLQLALETVAKKRENKVHGQNDLVQISTCEEAIQETRGSLKEEDEEAIFNRIIQRIQDI